MTLASNKIASTTAIPFVNLHITVVYVSKTEYSEAIAFWPVTLNLCSGLQWIKWMKLIMVTPSRLHLKRFSLLEHAFNCLSATECAYVWRGYWYNSLSIQLILVYASLPVWYDRPKNSCFTSLSLCSCNIDVHLCVCNRYNNHYILNQFTWAIPKQVKLSLTHFWAISQIFLNLGWTFAYFLVSLLDLNLSISLKY